MRNLCLNILLQSEPVKSPRGFEAFPKNFRIGRSRPWCSAPKNTCGSAQSVLTDETKAGFSRFISLPQLCIQLFSAGNFRRLVPGPVTFEPCRQYRNDISLFFGRQLPSGRDAVLLGQTPPAAAGCGMLGDKDRMPAHRGLPPVIGNNGRSETRAYEIRSVTPDCLHAFSLDIGDIFRFQTKSPAEPGCRQPGEQRIEGFCRMGIFNHFFRRLSRRDKDTNSLFVFIRSGGIFVSDIPGTGAAMIIRQPPAATEFPSSGATLSEMFPYG